VGETRTKADFEIITNLAGYEEYVNVTPLTFLTEGTITVTATCGSSEPKYCEVEVLP
jgi:hypothetical protein